MDRCDFCSVTKILREYISDERGLDQSEILYQLFESFFRSIEGERLILDNGQVCRWLNGQAKLSPQIISYYLNDAHRKELAADIEKNIIPLIVDTGMVMQKVYELVLYDSSVSEQKKNILLRRYPCHTPTEEASLLSGVLLFSIARSFVKRNAQTKELLVQGRLSPIIRDYVLDCFVPKPCKWFCGRSAELEQLHTLLETESKVFVYGIAGIGKSEFVKAYAAQYRKEYTNILYLTYSGDLMQDITDMDFVDDLPTLSPKERFRRHNQFLCSLKEDTLFIIDNFNSTETQDNFLSVVLKYRCRILFTTRSKIAGRCDYLLEEITDSNALFELFSRFYSDAHSHRAIAEKIIDAVHAHTFAVELAARLLEHGILSPSEVLYKLQTEKTSMDASDKIGVDKDGHRQKATYYEHLHTLFSLYQLSEHALNILRGLSIIPLTGIPARRFAEWMDETDMNTINDMIEMGFIQEKPLRMIGLHPMMQEITVTDAKPSFTNCHTLLKNLQQICLMYAHDIVYYNFLFQTIKNAISILKRDDEDFFLLFIEDAIPYMVKYHYESGIPYLLQEMKTVLDNPSSGKIRDRALLLDFTAIYEDIFRKKPENAIPFGKEALALFPEVTDENVILVSNLHSNLGQIYMNANKIGLAKEHMEQGLSILKQHGLTHLHDAIAQTTNYALLLGKTGEIEQGLKLLEKCARIVEGYDSHQCLDYANVQECTAYLYLMSGQFEMALQHFSIVLSIYRNFFTEEPERVAFKRDEIRQAFAQIGVNIAKTFF